MFWYLLFLTKSTLVIYKQFMYIQNISNTS